jgi:uroporphyrin-III C-methyltransferase
MPCWQSWPGRIGEELVAGGLEPATPAAVIQQGTVRGQRLLLSSLGELAQRVEACAPEPADAGLPIPF